MTFETLQKTFEKHNPWFLTKTLQFMVRALGYQLTEEVKVGFSLIDVLGIPIAEAREKSTHVKTPLAPPT